MWRINNSIALVEKEYGREMEAWIIENIPKRNNFKNISTLVGLESYRISVTPVGLEKIENFSDILNTEVTVGYYQIEVLNTTKDKLLTKEILAEKFIFVVNPISNKVTPSPKTKKMLKEY